MTNPEDVTNIVTGVFSLLGLIGLPVAVIAAPVIQIVTGVIGLRNTKKESKGRGGYYDG